MVSNLIFTDFSLKRGKLKQNLSLQKWSLFIFQNIQLKIQKILEMKKKTKISLVKVKLNSNSKWCTIVIIYYIWFLYCY